MTPWAGHRIRTRKLFPHRGQRTVCLPAWRGRRSTERQAGGRHGTRAFPCLPDAACVYSYRRGFHLAQETEPCGVLALAGGDVSRQEAADRPDHCSDRQHVQYRARNAEAGREVPAPTTLERRRQTARPVRKSVTRCTEHRCGRTAHEEPGKLPSEISHVQPPLRCPCVWRWRASA